MNIDTRDPKLLLAKLLILRDKDVTPKFSLGDLQYDKIKCIAQDRSGEWYGYNKTPLHSKNNGVWSNMGSRYNYIYVGVTELHPGHDTQVYEVTP